MAPTLDTPASIFADVQQLTPQQIAIGAPAVAIAAYVVWTLYVAFLGPLSSVPGPLLCKLTGAVDAYQTLSSGRRSAWIHSLHKEYGAPLLLCGCPALAADHACPGHAVRISPTLVSIDDPQALKVVYGGKFPKSNPRYFGKHMNGTEHMLVMNEFDKIKKRRNMLLPLFQRQNLEAFEQDLQHYTEIFLQQIEREQQAEGSVDFFRWYRLVAFDIICELAYGVDMKMTTEGKVNKLVELMEQVYIYCAFPSQAVSVTAKLT